MTTVRITDAGGNKPTFVQWDVDRVLYISGVSSTPCLHFANAELRRALVVQAEEVNGKWECKVPNFILQFACPMVVSVFVQPDEGCTVATAVYAVQPKVKPQDYSYTENIGYINWVAKSEEVQDLIDTIQGMLDSGELKGDPFTYDDFTEEQLEALKGETGDDGVSPTVSTEVTYYGNKVTFTDADGDHTINVLDGMTATVKSALLNLFQHVAYVDDQGQTYYDALYDAFNPVLNVDYITVVFDPGTAVFYNTYELAQLRPYITCTAHYDDGTSAEVDTYTLSGTLAAGTDTITVTYGGKSAFFTVTVVEWLVSIDAVFTQGSATIYDTDTLDTLEQYLTVTATYADSTTATVSDYTLSGTLTEGTSTITVSYGGKSTTFNVTVTANPLDQIAYGDKTYRDIFISENMCRIGDFEGTYNWDGNFHTLSNGDQYKEYSGTVVTTTTEYVSPTHSLKTFGTSPVRAYYKRPSTSKLVSGAKVLVGACIHTTRYVSGNVGAIFNAPIDNAIDRATALSNEVTSGFVAKASLASITATRSEFSCYIGVNGTGNADCYIDCVVLSVVPNTMTDEEAQTLYENYISYIVGGAK